MQVTELSDASRVSPAALAALAADADLPMCATCATQYPAPRRNCECCSVKSSQSEVVKWRRLGQANSHERMRGMCDICLAPWLRRIPPCLCCHVFWDSCVPGMAD